MNSDDLTDRERVVKAFRNLRKVGYTARMGFMCCGSCAGYALRESPKVVYYSQQSNDSYDKNGTLIRTLYLSWSGDIGEIIPAIQDAGLRVLHHTGNDAYCVEVIGAC